MKWISALILSFVLITLGATDQQYNISVPVGTPIPMPPTSPQALGVNAPEAIAAQGLTTNEKSQGYIQSTQEAAMVAPLGTQITRSTIQAAMVPTMANAVNNFYISSSPQTIASCYLYDSLPLWMSIGGLGPCWTYEWYPNGHLVTQYIGNFLPGLFNGWTFGDAPGWHIMQYYCSGWSNYIYIYVYPYANYYKNYQPSVINPTPSPLPPSPMPGYPISTPYSEYSEQMPLPQYSLPF